MNILMMTNSFKPYVCGVARSVETFADCFRRMGHSVLVVAPRFDRASGKEDGVVRVPAIQNFNGSDFSVRVAIPGLLIRAINRFQPDIVHSHHPFMLGDAALRVAAWRNLPLVFTHHTMYESYTHYVPGDSPAMKRFVVSFATGYANLCDCVIAPSSSVAGLLLSRGVASAIETIPTGVDTKKFRHADGAVVRRRLGIDDDDYVVGHVGRLAPEKNIRFLAQAVVEFVAREPNRHFVVTGEGPMKDSIRSVFEDHGVSSRLHITGRLDGKDLIDTYGSFDVFAFASLTETQGLVLVEAMSAGVPVVALDAAGVREVMKDGINGRMIHSDNGRSFTETLEEMCQLSPADRESLSKAAISTTTAFDMEYCGKRALEVYRHVKEVRQARQRGANSLWEQAMRRINAEWKVWSARAKAGTDAITSGRDR